MCKTLSELEEAVCGYVSAFDPALVTRDVLASALGSAARIEKAAAAARLSAS